MTKEPVLLKQYKLLGAVIDAPWATRLDHKVARHVIDRYYAKYGSARAALRYLEQATGSERNKIIQSLRRIRERGVINVIRRGSGTRPTEYGLNFDFISNTASGAAESTSTSGAEEGTPTGAAELTSTASSGASDGTKTYLRSMSTDMPTVSMSEDTPAVPAAPPVGGLEAAPAGPAVVPGGFDELWNAYPRKHQRAKARAAYKELAPDASLHARLVEKASQWASHYEQTGTEKRWWKHLHTWLAEEKYLEDLPEPYENPAAARSSERQSSTKSDSKSGSLKKPPPGSHRLLIVGAKIAKLTNNDSYMECDYRIESGSYQGREFSDSFLFDSEEEEKRLKAFEHFRRFRKATGISDPKEASDFVGCALQVTVNRQGQIQYGADE